MTAETRKKFIASLKEQLGELNPEQYKHIMTSALPKGLTLESALYIDMLSDEVLAKIANALHVAFIEG